MTFRQNLWTILVWFALDLGCSLTIGPSEPKGAVYHVRPMVHWAATAQVHLFKRRGQATKGFMQFHIFRSRYIHSFHLITSCLPKLWLLEPLGAMWHSDSLSYRLLALMQPSLAGTGCITVVVLMIGQVQYSNRGILFWELYASLFSLSL